MAEYTEAWYEARRQQSDANARLMVPDIIAATGRWPDSVLDVGCGDGAFLRWFHAAGATLLVGVDRDGPDDWAREVGGEHIRTDLGRSLSLGQRFDLALCLEVAEHLPESAAATLVDSLVEHAYRIVFSAAQPGQGGHGHVNEKPLEYWVQLFKVRGYVAQDLLRHRFAPDVSQWFRSNTLLISREGHEVKRPTAALTLPWYRAAPEDAIDVKHDLMGLGWPTNCLKHNACIDKARSELASQFLLDPHLSDCEWSYWWDDDMVPTAQQVIDLLVAAQENQWPVATAVYMTKERGGRIVHRLPGNKSGKVAIGPYARPFELDGCGFGAVAVHRSVFERQVKSGQARPVWFNRGALGWDFFRPTLGDVSWGHIMPGRFLPTRPYWNEDYSWSLNVRALDIPIWCHPQIVVPHQGNYRWGARDMGGEQ